MSPNAFFEAFHSSLTFMWVWRNGIESHQGRFMSCASLPDTILGLEDNYSDWAPSRIFLLPLEKIMRQKPTQKREDDRLLPHQSYFVIHNYFLTGRHLTSVDVWGTQTVVMRNAIYWDISLLLLRASCWFLAWFILRSRRWRRWVPPKRQWNFSWLHGLSIPEDIILP
jgi:hypothetical protein